MKAIVQNQYGSPDTLELKEVDNPTVGEGRVLVRIRAASLNAGDHFSMVGSPWLARFTVGFPRPRDHILGWDLAGEVEQVGDKVTSFSQGEAVYGATAGTLAEYAAPSEGELALKPSNLSFEAAAAVPTAALTALQALRDAGKVQPGMKVLVNGASGGVGTFAVQIGKALGAEVTGVCSTRNVELVRSLGADFVVDYTKEDFSRGHRRYDIILDNVGNRAFADCRRALTPGGIVLPNTGHAGMGYVIMAAIRSTYVRQQGRMFMTNPNTNDLTALRELIESGRVNPVIDRTYRLSETPEALKYLGAGHARGKVVVAVSSRGSLPRSPV
jgi:NADPH:quinone reductase-like Zn-dependent oxidoreductase